MDPCGTQVYSVVEWACEQGEWFEHATFASSLDI
jgi:hypothetical protein